MGFLFLYCSTSSSVLTPTIKTSHNSFDFLSTMIEDDILEKVKKDLTTKNVVLT